MKKRIVFMLLVCCLLVCTAVAAAASVERTVDNDALVFTDGDKAFCSACGQMRRWKKLTGAAKVTYSDEDHYYLAEDVIYEGTDTLITAPGTSKRGCLHLNGHDLTATNARVIQGSAGVLNVMGNGTVSGNYTHADYPWRGSTLDINTSSDVGTLNLYGGSYVKAAGSAQESVISISHNGGRINLFDGASVTAAAGEHSVFVSTRNSYTKGTAEPVLGIYGGSISGGNVYFSGETVTATKGPAALLLHGGSVSGGIEILGNTTLTLSGEPKVTGSGLQLSAGMILQPGQLTDGAQITVAAREVFTDTSGVANAKYFKPAGEMDYITENEDGTLSYFSNEPLPITGDGDAYCPVCKAEVTWTALGQGERVGTVSSGNKHYYLTTSQTLGNYMTLNASGTDTVQVCLHTNGYDISYSGRSLVGKNATLNLMGSGSICSDGTDATFGTGTLYVSNASAVINIYGSTVTTTDPDYAAIHVIRAGKINMYGGTVDGNGVSRAVNMTAGEFTLYGGTIQNGKTAGHGGNISMSDAVFTIFGGTVRGGNADGAGGNILADTDSILNIHGGRIVEGEASGQGGNLRVFQATVNMSGGVISDGAGGYNADNVWLVDSVMDMSGGVVYGTDGAIAGQGTAIKTNKHENLSTLTLSGGATVSGKNGQTWGNIYIYGSSDTGETAKLIIDKTWTGLASVAWGNTYGYGDTIPVQYGAGTGGYTGSLLYEGDPAQPNIHAGGDGTLVISGIQLGQQDGTVSWFADGTAAIEKHLQSQGSFLRVMADGAAFCLPDEKTVYIDFNGKTASITGSGTLCGMDSANDAYTASPGAATVADTVTLQTDVTGGENGYRYIALSDGNTVTFHRLDMYVSAVTLRTAAAGLYYNCRYSCDPTLADRVQAYGVVLSVQDMPGADFVNVATDKYTYLEDGFTVSAENDYTVTATSGSVFGIFKTEAEGRTAQRNAKFGEMKIYANAYIMLEDTTLVGDTANAGSQAGTAFSLFDALKEVNDNWENYAAEQTRATEFYHQWKELGMSNWAAQLNKIVPPQPYLEILPANEAENYSSFNLYLPAGDQHYAQYRFGYTLEPADETLVFGKGGVDPANSDLYWIQGAYIGTLEEGQFASKFRALSPLEIGFAVREEGASDFSGGYHGDEVLSAVSLTVDGQNVPLNVPLLTAFETLTFVQSTDIFRCNTPNVKLIEHTQTYTVSGNKLELTQQIQWEQGVLPLQHAYAPMLTAQRLDPDDTQRILTDTVEFYTKPNGELITAFDTSAYGKSWGSTSSETVLKDLNATAVKVYGKTSGFAAETGYTVLDSSIPADQQDAFLVIRYGKTLDSKVYFDLGCGVQPEAGTLWKTQVYYRLTYEPSQEAAS